MLPSSGYFKNIQCPYFKSGFCERSHCHFGHAKAASSTGRSLFARCLPDGNKDVLEIFDRPNILRSTSIEQTLQNNCGTSYGEENTSCDYIPTPVESHAPKVSSILKKSKSVKYPLSTVPEYRPTPISRLKQPGADSSDENSVESLSVSALSKKRKKVEEYDPTEVRCSFKKRVSFNLPSDDDKDDSHATKDVIPCVVLDSSDDDEGITPQFSDDEYEEDNISDEACSPAVEMEKTDVVDSNADVVVVGDTVTVDTSDNTSHMAPASEISSYCLVDKILTEVKKNETIENVHKQSLKATSAHVISDQKTHKSEVKDTLKSSSSKEGSEKPKKLAPKPKQELSLENVSQLRIKDEKLHKDSTKLPSSKKDNLSKHSDKLRISESPASSNKPSDKVSLDKKHHVQNQNKVTSISKTHSTSNKISSHSEERTKLQKIKSEPKEIDKRDRPVTKHSDSHKTRDPTKISEKDLKNIVNIKKSSKEVEKKRTKEYVKIQDEKVSSSCHASHKKTSSSEKRHSNSPTKKKLKVNNDVKTAVKSKFSPTVHKLSHRPDFQDSDLKNNDREIQVDVEDSTEHLNVVKSSPSHSDSDSDACFPVSDSEMDSDTYEECLRIFNEHEQSLEQKEKQLQVKDEKQENVLSAGKKRVAYEKAVPKPKVPKLEPPINPSQVMHNRYLQLQNMYARQNDPDIRKVTSAFVNSTSRGIETIKKRITVAPNADLVAAVAQKQKLLQSGGSNSSASNKQAEEITYVVTETKRLAHVPSQVTKPRPIIPVEYGCKVPSNMRQRYLNNFIDECLKFCSDQDEAYQMALDEEKKAYDRSSTKTVYLNVAINTLKRLRNQATEAQSTGTPTSSFSKSSPEQSSATADPKIGNKTISHEMMLGGARAQRTSFSIEKKKPKIQDTEIKGKRLYDALMSYVLTTEQLIENGYPLPHPAEPGKALITGMYINRRTSSSDPFKKICSRCQKQYQIDKNADYVKPEECEYHWGSLWQKRIGRSMERQYSCCGGDAQSDGCCLSPGHVCDGDENEMMKGYVKTLPKSPPPDGYYGVYALDCEMCYTTAGIELIRVTVINPDMKAVYESYVKPENKILDYNTRFSGITEEHLNGVETSLRDVQAVLLCLFNSKTILIGHSLESDFKALKLIHTTVVDTAVVFPHKRGPPYKRALRTLMAEYMRKIIQNSLEGHDSNEDAVACMELMLWKIKEDMKRTRL